ncbi:hypothetical protein J6590_046409 [Homalodisca vitripennis]|nr:hypothetical protein J6590_046409 [Homalodisca vitripennis]
MWRWGGSECGRNVGRGASTNTLLTQDSVLTPLIGQLATNHVAASCHLIFDINVSVSEDGSPVCTTASRPLLQNFPNILPHVCHSWACRVVGVSKSQTV